MEKYYNIAGINLCISGKDEEMFRDGRKLNAFLCEKTEEIYRYDYVIVEELEKPIGNCIYQEGIRSVYINGKSEITYIASYMRVEREDKKITVQVKRDQILGRITTKVIMSSLGVERIAVKANGFVMHSSYIVWNGKGILFTAPSGIGKTTQAELWSKYMNAEIINGDRAIIRNTCSGIDVCGLPFAGSSEYCKNKTVPLGAIVYLGQGVENYIEALKGKDAFCKILEGASVAVWNKEELEKVLTCIQEVVGQVPVYYFKCTPDEKAVRCLSYQLRKEW